MERSSLHTPTAVWSSTVSHIPSVAMIRNLSNGRRTCLTIYGYPVTPNVLKAWSPNALVIASPPATLLSMIEPPSFFTRSISAGSDALWLIDNLYAWPFLLSTALVSPTFATYKTLWFYSLLTIETHAVDPVWSESRSANYLSMRMNTDSSA